MNRIRSVSFVLLALIVAACGTSYPDRYDETTWCYRFDFTSETDYGLVISDGQRTVNGLESVDGALGAVYNHGELITVNRLVATVVVQLVDARQVQASIDAFGLQVSVNEVISKSGVQQIGTGLAPGEEGSAIGSSASVIAATASDVRITVQDMEVEGTGVNPFGGNNCLDNQLPTPEPTGTPTTTPTTPPTATTTPTITATVTATVESSNYFLGNPFLDNPVSLTENQAVTFGNQNTQYALAGVLVNNDKNLFGTWTINDSGGGIGTYLNGRNTSMNDNNWFCVNDDYYRDNTSETQTPCQWFEDSSGSYDDLISGAYRVYGFDLIESATNQYQTWELEWEMNKNGNTEPKTVYQIIPIYYGIEPEPTPTPDITPTPIQECESLFTNYSFDQLDGIEPVAWSTTGDASPGSLVLANTDTFAQSISLPESGDYDLSLILSVNDGGTDDSDGSASIGLDITTPESTTLTETSDTISEPAFYRFYNQLQINIRLYDLIQGENDFQFTTNLTSIDLLNVEAACIRKAPEPPPTATMQPTSTAAAGGATSTPAATYTPYPTYTPPPGVGVPGDGDTGGDVPGDGDEDGSGGETEDGTGGAGWSGQCGDPVQPPANKFSVTGWLKTTVGTVDKGINCILIPPLNDIRDFAKGLFDQTSEFFTFARRASDWVFGELFWVFRQGVGNIIEQLWWILKSLLFRFGAVLFAIIELVINVIAAIVGFIQMVLNFIFSAFSFASRLLGAWSSATPEKPPGLPDCTNNPMAYDICAVYYIMENTIFAGIGSFIMPAITLYMSVLVAFNLLDSVIERVQRIWRVTD